MLLPAFTTERLFLSDRDSTLKFMKLPRPIINEFRRNDIKIERGFMGQSEHFHIRVLSDERNDLEDGERRWKVQFAYKPTFDRWSNSTNFETEIWYSPKKNQRYEYGPLRGQRKSQYTIPKWEKELEWCLKCAKSGIFNFNSYFNVIKTPWFIY